MQRCQPFTSQTSRQPHHINHRLRAKTPISPLQIRHRPISTRQTQITSIIIQTPLSSVQSSHSPTHSSFTPSPPPVSNPKKNNRKKAKYPKVPVFQKIFFSTHTPNPLRPNSPSQSANPLVIIPILRIDAKPPVNPDLLVRLLTMHRGDQINRALRLHTIRHARR